MAQTGSSALGTALLQTIVVMIFHSTRDSLASLHPSQNATGQVSGAVRTYVSLRLNLVRIVDLIYDDQYLFVLEGFVTLMGNDILSTSDTFIIRLRRTM